MQEDDGALLRFLQSKFGKGRENGPEFFYDPKYALRLCLKEKRMRACVHIYGMMSMHEEAVALALQVCDYSLAFPFVDIVWGCQLVHDIVCCFAFLPQAEIHMILVAIMFTKFCN